ncbi:pyocin knob domain-containing protein [Paenibacillus sp. JSM ZJ436]|uniref:pyocin knob domain-containing protein n=1 Tax=Paenibacillus sp. JSM ZJ436 TaxID=3376190 RepID=UPI00378A6EE0
MASLSNFPNQVDTFLIKSEIQASDIPAIQRFQELKIKPNRTSFEESELANLTNQLRSKLMSADEWNKFQDALVNMQLFIKENVDDYITERQQAIETGKDNALIAINQKMSNIIVYLDGTTAGQLRNDIGVMGDLATTNKTSLVQAVNEVNAKVNNISIPDASTSVKGIVQLSTSTTSTSTTTAATPSAVKAAYDLASGRETTTGAQTKATTAETNAKAYTDAKAWQKVPVTSDLGYAIDISTQNLNTARKTGWYMGSNVTNAPTTGWWYFEIVRHNDSWEVQKAYDFNVAGSYRQRTKQNGVWTAWSEDLFQSVVNGKNAVAAAINGKNGNASGSDTFDQLASKISQISTAAKMASGSFTKPASNNCNFTIDNLNFTPSSLVLVIRAETNFYNYQFRFVNYLNSSGTSWRSMSFVGDNTLTQYYSQGFEVRSNGFTSTGYWASEHAYLKTGNINTNIEWIAIG